MICIHQGACEPNLVTYALVPNIANLGTLHQGTQQGKYIVGLVME
uniref:Uncharacterized protein n=1 Tax=Arundo donax TaxID=35708 RepID=A0A0A9C145_ARUDO